MTRAYNLMIMKLPFWHRVIIKTLGRKIIGMDISRDHCKKITMRRWRGVSYVVKVERIEK